jgi:alpha-L-fucosidase
MMRNSLITTITLLLVAAQRGTSEDYGYRVAEVIERLMDIGDWTDERKADLYALLAESVFVDDTMYAIETKVTQALQLNSRRWAHG